MTLKNRNGFLLTELMIGFTIAAMSASAMVILVNSTISAYAKVEAEDDLLQLRKELIITLNNSLVIDNTLADSYNQNTAMACLYSADTDCSGFGSKAPIVLRDENNDILLNANSPNMFSKSVFLPCGSNESCPFEVTAYWKPFCNGACTSQSIELSLEFENIQANAHFNSNVNPGKFKISRMISFSSPAPVPIVTGAQVISQRASLIFLDAAGNLFATGRNESYVVPGVGMLGTGRNDTMFTSPTPVVNPNMLPATGVVSASNYGSSHFCVIEGTNQAIKCTGQGAHGALGNGTQAANSVENTLQYAQLGGSDAIGFALLKGAGDGGNLARHTGGQYYFFGGNSYNRFGSDDYSSFTFANSKGNSNFTSLAIGNDMNAVPEIANSDNIALGRSSACAVVTPDNSVTCWGSTNYGQMGNSSRPGDPVSGGSTQIQRPGNANDKRVIDASTGARLTGVVDLAGGEEFYCAIVNQAPIINNRVVCWGQGTRGSLGGGNDGLLTDGFGETYNDQANYVIDTAGNPIENISKITVVGYRVCAQQGVATQTVFCWGRNDHAQLGRGFVSPHENRAQLLPLPGKPIVQVFMTSLMTGVLFSDGTYAALGRDYMGVFGVGPASVNSLNHTWVHGSLP